MNKYAIGTIFGAALISGVKKIGSSSKRLHRKEYAELVFSLYLRANRLTAETIEEITQNLLALDFVSEVELDDELRITSIHLDPRNSIELQIPTYCEQIAQVINHSKIHTLSIPFLEENYVNLEEWLEDNEEFHFMLTKRITGDPFKDYNYRIAYGAEYHGELLDGVFLEINGHQIIIEGYQTSEFWLYDEQGNNFMTSRDKTIPNLRKR
jgi:hypothetical protein